MTDRTDDAEEKKSRIMRNEKEILKQKDTPTRIYIKFGLRVAGFALCAWLIYQVGASALGVVGGYILIRSVLKIIRLSISVICSILSILFLIGLIALIIVFIF